MTQLSTQAQLKKKLILLVTITILIFALNWVRTHGYIEVQLSNATTSKEITYVLTDEKNGKVITGKSESSSFKRLVKSSDYEITITQSETSSVVLKHAKGMLGRTSVSANLQPEKSRSFVGNQPEGCMYFYDVLYSYDCGGDFSNLKKHIPATASEPTYAINGPDYSNLLLKGITTFEGKAITLTQQPDPEEDNPINPNGNPTLFDLDPNLQLSNPQVLTALNPKGSYNITPFQAGFLIYNDDFSQINKYSSLRSEAEKVITQAPSKDTTNPIELTTYGTNIAALYNSRTEETTEEGVAAEDNNAKENTRQKGQSEIIIYSGTSTKSYRFATPYIGGGLCGKDLLCLVYNGVLDVYSVNGDKTKLKFTLYNVLEVKNLSGSLLIVKKKEILSLDPSKLSGTIEYTFGASNYCGLGNTPDGYIVCVATNNGHRYALQINKSMANQDSIDKKMFELSKNSAISNLSIYGKYIYVSPETGDYIYKESVHQFGPDPEKVKIASDKINQEIHKLGIDRSVYTIINTLQ